MNRQISVIIFAATATGCASFSTVVPHNVAVLPLPIAGAPLEPAYVQFVRDSQVLQNSYLDHARALNSDSQWMTSLATVSTLAALGFGAFEAHPDNFKAATLIAGSSLVMNNQLQSNPQARFFVGAANSIQCVLERVRAHEEGGPPKAFVASGYNNPALLSLGLVSGASYEMMDAYLVMTLGAANGFSSPTPRLSAAIKEAEGARDLLNQAIKDRASYMGEAYTAVARIRGAVAARTPPDLASLLKELSAVTVPEKTAPTKASGSETKTDKGVATMSLATGSPATADEVAFALETLSGLTRTLNPQKETEELKGLTACVAAFAAVPSN